MKSSHTPQIGVALAALLSITSCGDEVVTEASDDAIEGECDRVFQGCPSQSTQGCVETLETFRDEAYGASCDDAFLAYFRSQQTAQPSGCLGSIVPNTNIGEVGALFYAVFPCIDQNDPDSLCVRANERLGVCAVNYFGFICGRDLPPIDLAEQPGINDWTGINECTALCILDATCEELALVDQDFARCLAACQFVGPLEGN